MKIFQAGNKSGMKTVQLQYSKAMAEHPETKPSISETARDLHKSCLNCNICCADFLYILGGRSRKSVPGSKLVTEICCDKQMRKAWHVFNMAAEQTMAKGEGPGKKASSLVPTDPPPAPRLQSWLWSTLGHTFELKTKGTRTKRQSQYLPKDEQVFLYPEAFGSEVAPGFVIEAPGSCGPFIRVTI